MKTIKSTSKQYIGGVQITKPLPPPKKINIEPILKIIKNKYNAGDWDDEYLDYISQYVNSIHSNLEFIYSKEDNFIMGFFEFVSNKLTKEECDKVISLIEELKQSPQPILEKVKNKKSRKKLIPHNYKNHKFKKLSTSRISPPKPNLINFIIKSIIKNKDTFNEKLIFKFRKEIKKIIKGQPYKKLNHKFIDSSLNYINESFNDKKIINEDLKHLVNFLKDFNLESQINILKIKREEFVPSNYKEKKLKLNKDLLIPKKPHINTNIINYINNTQNKLTPVYVYKFRKQLINLLNYGLYYKTNFEVIDSFLEKISNLKNNNEINQDELGEIIKFLYISQQNIKKEKIVKRKRQSPIVFSKKYK